MSGNARIRFDQGPSAYDKPQVRASSEEPRMNVSAAKAMNASVGELVKERERLDAEILAAKLIERKEVIAQIVDVVNTYDVPIDELIAALGVSSRKSGYKVAPKYRDPKTGVTWSGRGKTPVWLRDTPEDEWDRFAIPA